MWDASFTTVLQTCTHFKPITSVAEVKLLKSKHIMLCSHNGKNALESASYFIFCEEKYIWTTLVHINASENHILFTKSILFKCFFHITVVVCGLQDVCLIVQTSWPVGQKTLLKNLTVHSIVNIQIHRIDSTYFGFVVGWNCMIKKEEKRSRILEFHTQFWNSDLLHGGTTCLVSVVKESEWSNKKWKRSSVSKKSGTCGLLHEISLQSVYNYFWVMLLIDKQTNQCLENIISLVEIMNSNCNRDNCAQQKYVCKSCR